MPPTQEDSIQRELGTAGRPSLVEGLSAHSEFAWQRRNRHAAHSQSQGIKVTSFSLFSSGDMARLGHRLAEQMVTFGGQPC